MDKSTSRKRDEIIQRLEARSQGRKAKALKERQASAALADPDESSSRFWGVYRADQQKIQSELASQIETFKSETRRQRRSRCADDSTDPVAMVLRCLAGEIQQLQDKVTSASYFLAKYDLKSAQEGVTTLEADLQSAKTKLRPKKKFSFAGVRQRRERGQTARETAAALKLSESKSQVDGQTAWLGDDSAMCGLKITGKAGVVLRIPEAGSVCGDGDGVTQHRDVTLSDLTDSVVGICQRLNSMRMKGLTRCHIYCGPIDGSVFFAECVDCHFVLAARQVRIHGSTRCTFEVCTNSGPIIEDCTELRFGSYPGVCYEGSTRDFESSTLAMVGNENWREVKDFKWHRAQASPNWSFLAQSDRLSVPKNAEELLISFGSVGEAAAENSDSVAPPVAPPTEAAAGGGKAAPGSVLASADAAKLPSRVANLLEPEVLQNCDNESDDEM